jgi:hypothetical protein
MNTKEGNLQRLPDFIFNIGITGHRKIDSDNVLRCESAVSEVLQVIKRTCLELNIKKGEEFFSPNEPECRLITLLAEGADRIAARAAYKLGLKIQSVLPMEKTQYEKDFLSDESVNEFEKLLKMSSAVYEIALNKTNNSRVYLEAGELMLAHCDALIAVWDGFETGGIGGTADIVSRAVAVNLPVIWINSEDFSDVRIFNQNDEPAGYEKYLQDYIKLLMIPQTEESVFPDFNKEPPKDNWFSGFEKSFINFVYNISGKREESVPDERSSSFGNDEAIAGVFFNYFKRLDSLAVTFAGYYRTAGILRQLLPLFAVISLAVGFYWGLRNNAGIMNVAGFFLQALFLALIILLSRMNKIQKWHLKFTDYRLLAEYLRYAEYLYPFGSVFENAKDSFFIPGKKSSWTNWYYRGIIRQAGIPDVKFDEDLFYKHKKLLLNLLTRQIQYHEEKVEKHNRLTRFFEKNGLLLYNIGLVVTLLRVVVHFLKIPFNRQVNSVELPLFFNMLSMIIPAFATALFGIAAQGNFQRLEQRSKAMAELLSAQKTRITGIKKPGYSSLKTVAEEISDILISEILDWNILTKSKGISKH